MSAKLRVFPITAHVPQTWKKQKSIGINSKYYNEAIGHW